MDFSQKSLKIAIVYHLVGIIVFFQKLKLYNRTDIYCSLYNNLQVYPDSGPEKGGTNITISNIGIGYPGDIVTVKVNGIKCIEAKVEKKNV